jgi:hypothetical protein
MTTLTLPHAPVEPTPPGVPPNPDIPGPKPVKATGPELPAPLEPTGPEPGQKPQAYQGRAYETYRERMLAASVR